MAKYKDAEEFWRSNLTRHPAMRIGRRIFRSIPSGPRCKLCHTPFGAPGGSLMRLIGRVPSPSNPTICDPCTGSLKKYPGGAELEISMLFADIRGSTTLAEQMSTAEFSELMRRFYAETSVVLVDSNGLINHPAGDQTSAFYFPAFASTDHARVAIQAGIDLLRAVGYGTAEGAWIPVGVGVHTGVAFAGAAEKAPGVFDYVVLGDSVNITARLSSEAAAGELLVSDAAATAAGYDTSGLEPRELQLKGRNEPVRVWVHHVESPSRQAGVV
jgi:adenylate cyclase